MIDRNLNSNISFILKKLLPHVGFWSLYVLSEYLANYFHYRPEHLQSLLRNILFSLPIVILPTYFVTSFLVPKYLSTGKVIRFSVGIVATAIFIFFSRLKWLEIMNFLDYDVYQSMPSTKVVKNVIRDYAIVALAVCISIIGDWRAKRKLNEQLAEAKTNVEIQLLKAQLHPHFLFNMLNNIYSLALKKSDLTADSILRLTHLLDYLVYWSDKKEVAVRKEVALIRNYGELEKLRHGDRLLLNLELDDLPDHLRSSPLILLPFVENAFKHGGKDENGKIWINIRLKHYDNKIVFNIENSISARRKKDNNGPTGIGLENIKKRLAIMYPESHHLNIEKSANHYGVRLEITLDE